MAKFVITKTVGLDFLGEKYTGSEITVRSIAMRERDGILKTLKGFNNDPVKEGDFVRDLVVERFVSGTFKEGDKTETVSKDDLLDFPAEVFIEVMRHLNGAASSPN